MRPVFNSLDGSQSARTPLEKEILAFSILLERVSLSRSTADFTLLSAHSISGGSNPRQQPSDTAQNVLPLWLIQMAPLISIVADVVRTSFTSFQSASSEPFFCVGRVSPHRLMLSISVPR